MKKLEAVKQVEIIIIFFNFKMGQIYEIFYKFLSIKKISNKKK